MEFAKSTAREAGTSPKVTSSDTARGTTQTGVKLYNERLVLSLVRTHGSLSKGEISRLTGLSAQAASVIMNQLEADGLLSKGVPQRGKVGQPSTPMSLNPEGAFSLGFKVGRRSAELVLMDMAGTARQLIRIKYAYPTPEGLKTFFRDRANTIFDNMTRLQYQRITGIGIAVPSEMWSWEEEVGAPHDVLEAWRHFDLKSEIEKMFSWPVQSCNDATAACAAELAFGEGRKYPDFLYIFFATLIGGGVVLDGSLYAGRQGYAGSIGSTPIPSSVPGMPAKRLIQCASIFLLERMISEAGGDPSVIWNNNTDWRNLGPVLDQWIDKTTDSLALAIVAAISVIDFHNVVIDGGFPAHVRTEVVRLTKEKVAALDTQGVAPVDIVEGKIGSDARVLGAASLPLLAEYARDRNVLFS
ncbi:ROK family transcriptional regulator [Aestuariivirga litoralis]|uniref:ROK family transcriptional regulator n=1 Tax=Aestuariivirga litoralis TaxID=2650924 RepID=UPI001FF0294E|nr:ROK family transcriptional regulator [Aestuariivirga litoralis]